MATYDSLIGLQNYLYANLGQNFEFADVADNLKAPGGADETDFYLTKVYPAFKATGQSLTGEELFDFVSWYRNKYRFSMSTRIDIEDEFRRYFLLHVGALYSAKEDFNGGTFGNELYYEEIRPETYFAYYNPATSGSPTSPVKTFQQSVSATGWTKPYMQFNNNYDGSADTTDNPVSQLSDNVALFMFGDLDASTSKLSGQLQWVSSDGSPLGIEGTNNNYMPGASGLSYYKRAMYVGVNKRLSVDRSFIGTGNLLLLPLGMQIVTKEYHTQE